MINHNCELNVDLNEPNPDTMSYEVFLFIIIATIIAWIKNRKSFKGIK